jgi:transglutaminase-like putative cysteine protease
MSVLPLFAVTTTRGWVTSAAIAVMVVTATGYALRGVRAPAVLIPLAQLAVLTLWLGVLVASDVAILGVIPTLDWATRIVDVFRDGAHVINTATTPVPVPDGILLILVGGAGLVALTVEALISVFRRVPLCGVPLAACYAVAAAVVDPGWLAWWWFLPPAAGFLGLLIAEGRGRVAAWGRSASPSPAHVGMPETGALARNGRRVGMVALAAAAAVPGMAPVLTGGIIGSGRGGGDQTIRTDNPIVDLQRNLQRPENVEVLRYRSSANRGAYIRIVTLDVFNGERWETSDRPVPESVDNGLPWPPGLQHADVPTVDYSITVTDNFSSHWLPLPYPAQEIDIDGDWRYHTATLDVVANHDDARSHGYNVRTLAVQPTVEALRSAGPPSSDVAPALTLPDNLPSIVTQYAESVTAGATDDFSRAAALQQWFRSDGEFVYDDRTQSGHSATALTDFLIERHGYCEQFAATMAIMARYLGIPARVAVGFTPGTNQGDSTWLVRAHDMHAWPELYFEGVGWVRFEPTPASRTGTPPEWTFVPSQGGTNRPTDQPVPSSQPTRAIADLPADTTSGGGVPSGDRFPSRLPLILIGLGAVAVVVSVPWLSSQAGRRSRWRRAGNDAACVAEAAWADLQEAVRDAGLAWDRAATPRTMARRVMSDAGLGTADGDLLSRLSQATEQARYARQAPWMPSLRADAASIRRSIFRSRSVSTRIRAFMLPARFRDTATDMNRMVVSGLHWLDSAGMRLRGALTTVVLRVARSQQRS